MDKWTMVFWFMVGVFALQFFVAVLLSWLSYRIINKRFGLKSRLAKILVWIGLMAVFVPAVVWVFAYIMTPAQFRKRDRELRSATKEGIGFVNSIKFDYVSPVRGDDPPADKIAYDCAGSRYLLCDSLGKKITGEVKMGYFIPGTATFYTYKDGRRVRERQYEAGRLVQEHDIAPLSADGLYGRWENIKVYCKDGRIRTPMPQYYRSDMCDEE